MRIRSLAVLSLAFAPQAARAQDAATPVVHGVVMAREAGLPLAYSVVSVQGQGTERFTDERGRFTLVGLQPGRYRLRVKHLGFTPREVALDVALERSDTLVVQLSRIAVRLAAMHVRADAKCTAPGPPSANDEPEFAMLFEQLGQNADRLRLLDEVYPYVSRSERTIGRRRRDGREETDLVDTVLFDSRMPWQYRRGKVISAPMIHGHVEYQLNIPTLRNFADEEFQRSHCFAFAGVDSLDGVTAYRVDFRADSRIREPDVDGSFFVDTGTYQILRSEVRLTRPPRQFRNLETVIAVTTFAEIAEGVPVVRGIEGVNRLRSRSGRNAVTETTEHQRLVHLEFLSAAPAGVRRAP